MSGVRRLKIGGIALGSLAVTRFSVPAAVVIGVLTIAVIAAVCWTICDRERSDRLALLISAVRGRPVAGEPPVTVPHADLSPKEAAAGFRSAARRPAGRGYGDHGRSWPSGPRTRRGTSR
jgi:hypothetical protein